MRRTLGNEHPNTMNSIICLGALLRELEAATEQTDSLAGEERDVHTEVDDVLERLADPGVRLIVPRPSPGGLRYELSHDRLARVLADLTDEQVLGRGETFDRELLDLAAFIGRRSELFSHAGDAAAVQLDRGQTRAVRERGAELLWGEERRAWWAACQAAAAERTRRRRRWTALGMVALLLLALAVWQGFVRQSRAALERQLVESGDADTILAATAGLLDGHGLDADDLASVLDRRQEPPPPEALFGETTLAAGREAARLAIARAGAGRARLAEDFGAVIGSLDELRRSGDPEIASEAGARRREVLAALSQRFSAPPKEEDIEWVDVPGGTFTMGCVEERDAPCDGDERPPHEVTLSPFRMLAHEVTIGQMAAFEDASFYRGEDRQTAAFAVNWYEAVAYAAWVGGRLPTEAEWEYACRAGSPARYAGGPKEADVAKMAWYAANSGGKAHAVKTREPNAWGLHDLHGNLWEWASDRYGGYAETAANDPAGPAVGALRVLRGGSWDYPARNLRASLRNWLVPGNRNWYIGFRVVRPAPEP